MKVKYIFLSWLKIDATSINPKKGDSVKEQYLQSGRQCGKIIETQKNFDTAKLTKYSNLILAEYRRAKDLHPLWPDDIIHAVAIMSKKSCEASIAALKLQYENGNIEDVERELIETAAMCLRCLINIER